MLGISGVSQTGAINFQKTIRLNRIMTMINN
jgi:hypothetical protein